MNKKKIYINFDSILNNHDNEKLVENFLEKLSKNYEIYIFTTKNRETVYKWMIRHHLYEYIQDVTNTKECWK